MEVTEERGNEEGREHGRAGVQRARMRGRGVSTLEMV
jgi:hypothetical protein